MKRLKNKGLSLIEVLMSMAVLSVVLVGYMELQKSTADSDTRSNSHIDYIQLNSEFLILIDKDENCTASLANPDIAGVPSPIANRVSFNASDLDNDGIDPPIPLQIELWTGTIDALRSRRKLAAGMKYGGIEITSLYLHLPDHNTGDLPGFSPVALQAEIVLEGTLRNSRNTTRPIIPLKKLVLINVDNDGTGISSIRGCGGIHAI